VSENQPEKGGGILKTVVIALVIVAALLGGVVFYLSRSGSNDLPFDYEGR
jgi:hypothetical protein